IHGTKGSLSVPDPNRFDGEVKLWTPETGIWEALPSQHRSDIQRGIGVADMARSIRAGEPHRASGDLALHVLEVMLAFDAAAQHEQHIRITHGVDQPAALPPNRE
ncbi:MAG: gfo/Idh/MocA family oxidoreductase, partial [Chloroflexota bacterium]